MDEDDITVRVVDGWVLEGKKGDAPCYLFGGQEVDLRADQARELIAVGAVEMSAE